MPTYEYECTECGKVVDLFQSITESPRRRLRKSDPKPCECNAPVRRRIGTGAGIIFKGSGFYQTDYRSDSYKKDAKADKESSDAKGKSDKGGGKDKPAAGGKDGTTPSTEKKKDPS